MRGCNRTGRVIAIVILFVGIASEMGSVGRALAPAPKPGKPGPIIEWNMRKLPGHPGGGRSVAFGPDGKTLASGGADHVVRLWDVATGKSKAALKGHAGAVWSVAFSPDGKTLVAGSGLLDPARTKYIAGEIKVWDVQREAALAVFTDHTRVVNCLSFQTKGQFLTSAADDGTVRLWGVDGGKLQAQQTIYDAAAIQVGLVKQRVDAVSSSVFSPDGKLLAFDREGQTIVLWDVDAKREKAVMRGHAPYIRKLAFSADGRMIASAGDEGIKLWDVAKGKELATLSGHKSVVFAVAFSMDGKSLVSGSNDGEIKVWDVATRDTKTLLDEKNDAVYSLVFSPDGKTLAAARSGGSVIVWNGVP